MPIDIDRWAKPGSKLRRVLERLADGNWHSGAMLHAAERGPEGKMGGWTFDSCLAQLRKKGMEIQSRSIPGEEMFEYRMIVPPTPAVTIWYETRRPRKAKPGPASSYQAPKPIREGLFRDD